MRADLARGAAILAVAGLVATAEVSSQERVHPAHAMAWGTEFFILGEALEYATSATPAIRFDVASWLGGASRRLWIKSEGGVSSDERVGQVEWQALFGQLIAPNWDLQLGGWLDGEVGGDEPPCGGVALGVQGLAPGWFEVESALLVGTRGEFGLRFTAAHDLYVTQRLVVQPTIEGAWSSRPLTGGGSRVDTGEREFALRARTSFDARSRPMSDWSGRVGSASASVSGS